MSGPGNTGRRRDDGTTLVELAVAMTILSVLLAVFGGVIRVMAATTARVQGVTTAMTQVRQAGDLLARQLAPATAANAGVQVGQSWYLEFVSDALKTGGDPLCTQWRYTASDGTLAWRTWSTVRPAATATGWSVSVRGLVNDVTQPPLTLLPSGGGFEALRVASDLRVRSATGPVVRSQGQYTLRNSLDAPAPTASTVCTELGRS